jgi:predicted nucleic acid-binding Zn ribbon protein
LRRWLLSLLLALASIAFAHHAQASDGMGRLHVDWAGFADAYRALTTGAVRGATDLSTRARGVSPESSAWFGSGVLVSIVARDWQGATRLAGGPLSVTDAVRTSNASRMLVTRVGLGGGRIVPYVHIGAGQWRDPDQHLRDAPLTVAAEAGAGFETLIDRRCAVAFEYETTALYRDDYRNAGLSQMQGFFAVARWTY